MAQPTKQVIPSRYSVTPIKFAFTAGVVSPGQVTTWAAGDILVAYNSDGAVAYDVQMVSNPTYKRGSDTVAAFELLAGEYCLLPRFPPQDSGTITIIVENVAVKIARVGTAADPA